MEGVDVDDEIIFNNVFEDYFKDTFKGNQEFLIYLSELSSYGIEKLNGEPRRLEEKREQVLSETRAMAFDNYKTFIHTANCCKDIFQDFQIIERNIEGALETLPEVSKSSKHFLQQAREINASRKVNNLTLAKYAQILEVLEVSQLMDTCVRNEYYEESLELLEYVARLERKLMHIPLIQNIVGAVKQSKQQMLQQLLMQLRSNIQLPECLKVVGLLRRMAVLPEMQLRMAFLQARDSCFQNALHSIPQDDAYQYISKSIEVTRVHLFDICTQYRAIFSDHHNHSFSHSQTSTNNSCLFHGWILQKVSDFLTELDARLQTGVQERLDSLLTQAMYFGLSFARLGFDFRPLLVPLFQRALLPSFHDSLLQANARFEDTLKHYTLVGKQTPSTAALQDTLTTSGPLHPPSSILSHPPLAFYLNHLLTALNNIRNCLLFPILCDVIKHVTTSLQEAIEAMIKFYRLEQASMCEREEEEFAGMSVCMVAVVVHVAACVQAFFQGECLQEVVGSVFMHEKEMAEAGFCLDVEGICRPLNSFLPSKSLQITTPASSSSQPRIQTTTPAIHQAAADSTPQEAAVLSDVLEAVVEGSEPLHQASVGGMPPMSDSDELTKVDDVVTEVDDIVTEVGDFVTEVDGVVIEVGDVVTEIDEVVTEVGDVTKEDDDVTKVGAVTEVPNEAHAREEPLHASTEHVQSATTPTT